MGHKKHPHHKMPTDNMLTIMFLIFAIFKIVPVLISGLSIYLGYRLFILGVTGKASISIETNTLEGQLINASPGLFFALGGLITLIIIVWKGLEVKVPGISMKVKVPDASEHVRESNNQD